MNPLDFPLWADLTDEDLASMPFNELQKLRMMYPDKQAQNKLAPYEHAAYVRQLTMDQGPIAGALPMILAPGYALAKKMSPTNLGARSDPSFDQIGAGFRGYGQGVVGWAKNRLAQ
jgi:hypothetical protein